MVGVGRRGRGAPLQVETLCVCLWVEVADRREQRRLHSHLQKGLRVKTLSNMGLMSPLGTVKQDVKTCSDTW